ncbi:SIR2 family NAD-dependent protein deacylase [Clavibacter michiganensis]|uniref:SIR2 family NAD-dependent protein deacylase n=1 Tax=Clavibacter michiganensis TaxID=28447 RepID=UPI001C65309C|nr:SIR2 family protein [Clavibacter michiganensis]
MKQQAHSPTQVATLLARKLATRERHVSFLLGAGASRAAGLPDMGQLKAMITAELRQVSESGTGTKLTEATSITSPEANVLLRVLSTRDIEEALTWVRKVAALLKDLDDEVDEIDETLARTLDKLLSTLIMNCIVSAESDIRPFNEFATWMRTTSYSKPIEVFTLNYDLLLEYALERQGLAYFDGFMGTYHGRFRADLVDGVEPSITSLLPSFFHRVWKLHGSLSWARDEDGHIVRYGHLKGGEHVAAIHPSESKYEDSRRAPFVILQDRFRRSLFEPETLLITSGYSFGDQHINEILADAIRARPRSEFVFMFFGEVPKYAEGLAAQWRNVTLLGPDYGIVGGIKSEWDKDEAHVAPFVIWSNEKFTLGDFAALATFLARSSPETASAAVEPEKRA